MSTTLIVILGIIVVVVGYFYFALRRMKKIDVPTSTKIKTLTGTNFKQQVKSGVTLVDFWATWCMPCKMMVPVLNELADELDGKITIGKVDVDQNQPLAGEFKVRSIPTLVLLKNGKEINRFVGVKDKKFLLKQLSEVK
ncbi:MAG TPA: thioredoxin [Williamwhitmania sp.]|nr:thioredoxin [Williamwhitmania sp.]